MHFCTISNKQSLDPHLNCSLDKELLYLALGSWLGLRMEGKVTLELYICDASQPTMEETSQKI